MAAIIVGLVLLGLCASGWNQDTGSTIGQAFRGVNGGDRSELRSLGNGALQQTSQTGVEGVAGLFWVAIGAFLLKKAAGDHGAKGDARRRFPPRR